MNSVNFSGRLGNDMELRLGSMEVGKFPIFIKKFNKNKDDDGFWIQVTVFKPNDFLKDVLKKGIAVAVSGRLDINEHEGKYYTSVLASVVDVFNPPDKGENSKPSQPKNNDNTGESQDLPF